MELVTPLTKLDLLRDFDEARSEADEIIVHIQKLLGDPGSIQRLEFLLAVHRVRRQLEETLLPGRRKQDRKRRDGDAGAIRKTILAIWLRVSRLAGMWEALLQARR